MASRRMLQRIGVAGSVVLLGVTVAHPSGRAVEPPFPLDTSFASTTATPGVARLQLNGQPATATGVVVMDDGRIVVSLRGLGFGLNTFNGENGLARFLADGTLDPGFSGDDTSPGVALVTSALTNSLSVDATGGVVFGGESRVSRVTSNGDLDVTFGCDCIHRGVAYVGHTAHGISVMEDGSILTVGSVPTGIEVDILTPSGRPDTTYNITSLIPQLVPPGSIQLVRLGDGSFIVVDKGQSPAFYHLTTDGMLDTGYGAGGRVAPGGLRSGEHIGWVSIDASDRLLLQVYNDAMQTMHFVRVSTSGTLDTTWGTAGRLSSTVLGVGYPGQRIVMPGGRVIVRMTRPSRVNELVALTSTGRLDPTFNRLGTHSWALPVEPFVEADHQHDVGDLAPLDDNRFVVVGGIRPIYGGTTEPSNLAEVYIVQIEALTDVSTGAAAYLPAQRFGPATLP